MYSFKTAFQLLKDEKIIQHNSSFIQINEGLVHDIYKIKSKKNSYFLKIRLNHFKYEKNIKIKPKDIIYEKKALEITKKYCKNFVPKIIYFKDNFLLLESMEKKLSYSVYSLLYNQSFSYTDAKNIGKQIKQFHKKISLIKTQIRSKNDEIKIYNNCLRWRFEVWNNKNLNNIVNELKHRQKKQFIYADFNAKNMILSKNKLKIFDLELFHKGDPLFDVGFFAGHILLSFLDRPILRIKLLQSFFNGYDIKNNELQLVIKIMLATVYFRLSVKYPYAVKFDYNKKTILKKIDRLLSKNCLTLNLISNI